MTGLKRVVSVSIGSATRNSSSEIEVLGERIQIERIGTDGDLEKAAALIRELDGKVDAIGIGGMDLYIGWGQHKYVFRDAKKLIAGAKQTPIVDGTGLKDGLEAYLVKYLQEAGIDFSDKKVLVVSMMDRFGLGQALTEVSREIIYGDLMFCLQIPIPLRRVSSLKGLARIVAPVICQLPFKLVYPTGAKQHEITPRFQKYYAWADVIAGDFHFIRKFMPEDLSGKMIITNTVTPENRRELQARKVATLVTTTPNIGGRAYGTNVMEALLVAISGRPAGELTPADYLELLLKIGFKPDIQQLNN
jgi:hypothetical protein